MLIPKAVQAEESQKWTLLLWEGRTTHEQSRQDDLAGVRTFIAYYLDELKTCELVYLEAILLEPTGSMVKPKEMGLAACRRHKEQFVFDLCEDGGAILVMN
jgi:hypothetical protein